MHSGSEVADRDPVDPSGALYLLWFVGQRRADQYGYGCPLAFRIFGQLLSHALLKLLVHLHSHTMVPRGTDQVLGWTRPSEDSRIRLGSSDNRTAQLDVDREGLPINSAQIHGLHLWYPFAHTRFRH